MKLFTALRAVGLAGLIVALSGFRLVAQDVTVTDPAWFDPEKPGADVLPQFKKKPSPDYPRELKKEQPGYVLAWRAVDEKGGTDSYMTWASHPYLSGRDGSQEETLKFKPATTAGKGVGAKVWYAVLFHPSSASMKGADAEPRLLSVAPVVVSAEALNSVPGVKNGRLTVWAKIALDAAGTVQGFTLANPAHEGFRPAIEKTLASAWRFAPARHQGQSVAGEMLVAFCVMELPDWTVGSGPDVRAKAVLQVRPKYPRSLLMSGHAGEVMVQYTIDEKGGVEEAAVVSSNHPAFEEPALEAVRQWKFTPASKAGKPVKMRMRQAIVFNMTNDGQRAEGGAVAVSGVSKKNQEALPEELRYDVPPKPQGVLYPAYPYELLLARTSGMAEVRCVVREDGRVSIVQVMKADRPEFGEALSAAMAGFEFVPALKEGHPVPAVLKMEHRFDAGGWTGRPSTEDLAMVSLVNKHPEKIVSPKALDAPLKPVSRRSPVFPSTVKADSGEAMIEVLVDTDGRARLPRIVSASELGLGYAAAQAAGEWRFEVPKSAGKAVVVRVKVPFKFGQPQKEEAVKSPEAPASP